MGAAILKNNAVSKLASSLTTGATALSVTAGQGDMFPTLSAGDWFPVTLVNAVGALELVKCTARTGDVLTVIRAQEGTAALAFAAGDRVELRMSAAVIEDINARLAQTVTDLAATIASLGLTGAVSMFAQTTAPAGWLKANGAAISRTTYAALFAVIGTSYGAGDGTTTFNLPDPRGMFTRALDDGRGKDVGRAINTVQAPMLLSHAHTGSTDIQGFHSHDAQITPSGDHTHVMPRAANSAVGSGGPNITTANGADGATAASIPAGNHLHAVTITPNGNHQHNVTVAAVGGAENRPENFPFLYCIKY